MEDKNYYMNEKIGNSGIANTRNPIYASQDYKPFKVSSRRRNVGDIVTPNSKYDETLGNLDPVLYGEITVDDLRAQQQSGLEMIGNSLANNVVIAGTTAISGTLGLVNGIFSSLSDRNIEKLWDNKVNNWATEVQEKTREALPIYRGKEYEDKSIFQKLGTGIFWADLVQNLGYAEGMLIPGVGMSKILTSAPKLVRGLASVLASSIGEASIEAINTKNDEINNKLQLANDEYNRLYSNIKSPFALSVLESEYNNTIDSIEKDSINAGNFVFGSNIALLSMSNALQFGNLFSRGFGTAKRLKGTLKRKGNLYSSDNMGLHLLGTGAKKILDATSEGIEEVSQGIISRTPSNYSDYNTFNSSVFNPEKRELVTNIWQALGESYAQAMQDSETAAEFASGFLIGALGIPTIKKGKFPIGIENNIGIELYDTYKSIKGQGSLADKINQRLQDNSKINSYYNGLVRHLSIQDSMNASMDEDNTFDYKTAESAQLISDIMMFDDAGDIENLKAIINSSIDMSDEGIDNIIEETSNNGDGPFMHNGNPLDRESVRYLLNEKITILNNKIDSYVKEKEYLESTYPNMDSDTLSNALFLKEQFKDQSSRYVDLLNKTYNEVINLFQSEKTKSNQVLPSKESFLISLHDDSLFRQHLNRILENESSTMTYDERQVLKTNISDLFKLENSLTEINKSLKSILTDSTKSSKDLSQTKNNAESVNSTTNDIKRKDDINKKSISELNKNINDGALNIEELEAMIPEGFNPEEATSTQEKAFEVINMQKDKKRIKDAISNSNVDEQTKDDALNLFNANFALSESSNELADLSSEAINDINNMVLEDDPSITQLSSDPEALEEALNLRHLKAKSLLSQVVRTIKNEDESLKNIPLKNPILSLSSQDVIGNDAIEKQVPINTPKNDTSSLDSIIAKMLGPNYKLSDKANLKEVLSNIQNLFDSGADKSYLINTIMDTKSFKDLSGSIPSIINDLSDYVNNLYVNEEVSQETIVDMYNPNMTDDDPTNHTETLNKNNVDYNKEDNNEVLGIHESWLSPLSYYSRISKDFTSTFADFVESTNRYSDEKKKRILAIWDYLDNHNVFKYIDNNGVKVGDKVTFTTDNSLNDSAGELVIIMKANDHIIGVLPSENDTEFNTYIGLSEFVSSFKEKYNNQGNPDGFTFGSTTINKNMVGKIPYSSVTDTNTLNAISTETTSSGDVTYKPILLGISAGEGKYAPILTSGARKSSGKSALEKSIMSPLNATKGQPYMLIETSDPKRKYIPIPFLMDPYSREHENTALGKAINKVLESLHELSPKDVMKAKTSIQELLAIPELHINFTKEGNLKIDYKPKDSNRQITIYNGSQNNPELVQSIKDRLYGTPYQVSRKYINITYKGQNYNNMIGEIARTNLPIGTTHTVDDWFNINRVDKDGNEVKSRPIKSKVDIKPSPKESYYTDTYKGINIKVNLETFEVTDDKGKYYRGPKADIYKAKAYGYKNNITKGVIQTEWGTFNLDTNQFVKITKEPSLPYDVVSDLWINREKYANYDESAEGIYRYLYEASESIESLKVGGDTSFLHSSIYNLVKEAEKLPSHPIAKKILSNVIYKESYITSPVPEKLLEESPDEQARKKGFLNSAKRKAMWGALNSFQKEAILNKTGLEQKQVLINLDGAFNVSNNTFDSKKLGNKSLDEYLNTKSLFRRVNTTSLDEVKESELKWMQENLPNLSSDDRIKVVDGLIKISDEEGFAYGQFRNGIITLSNKAARGTIYHESFHSVVHTLLSNSEREYLLKEAKDKYGDLSEIELEENLAESFRRYMQIEETPFVGRAVKIFRKLKHILNNLFGKESYLDKIYYNINNKIYADRIPGITSVSRNMTVEQFQGIVDSNINNERLYPKNKVSDIHNAWGKLIDNWIRKGYEIKGTFDKKTKNYKVKSVKKIDTLREELINIEQYHRDKLSFGNLSKEDQQYIINRGLSIEEYNKMSKFEREVFLHCRH